MTRQQRLERRLNIFGVLFFYASVVLGEGWNHHWWRCPEIHIALPHIGEPIWKVSE
jgi:hypothetical protein